MKKFINYFDRKLCALLLCAGLAMTGCYDDSALQEQLKDHESRLKELERLTAQQNTNISSLQTIVTALQDKDYVTSVAPIYEGDEVVGYTITFSKSGAVTIYNGKDGYVPAMGVKQDESDGQWYWTVDGEWLLDSKGGKVRASAEDGEEGAPGQPGVTPTLKIVDGYWYVSYDGGKTWEEETLGQATGDKGYTMFAEVSYDDDYLYITMSDGQKLTLPRASSSQGEGGEGEGDVEQVGPIAMKLSEVTASTVTFRGTVTDTDAIPYIEKITVYYKEASETFSIISARSASTTEIGSDNTVSISLRLPYNTSYSYCLYVKSRGFESYSDVKQFTTVDIVPTVSVDESSITATTASFSGTVTGLSEVDKSSIEVGMAYSSGSGDLQSNDNIKISSSEISEDWTYSMSASKLSYGTKYYYCSYVKQNGIYKYGEIKEFTTVNVIPDISVDESSITAATASFSGRAIGLSQVDMSEIEVGMAFSSEYKDFLGKENNTITPDAIAEGGIFDISLRNISYGSKYYYCPYIKQNGIYKYGEVKDFTTVNVTVSAALVDILTITGISAVASANVSGLSEVDKQYIKVGVECSCSSYQLNYIAASIEANGEYSVFMDELNYNYKNYYRSYIYQNGEYDYSNEVREFIPAFRDLTTTLATNLSSSATANCYIISKPGTYKLKTVKGNSSISVGNVSYCTILWESFGTDVAPNPCDLIANVCYNDNYIIFCTPDTFMEGNAVIAARDENGNILWSWHIWLTDQPKEQVYYNNAGTMMDRNLGATSATPRDVGAFGLLYQWGRKDPFLGAVALRYSDEIAASTTIWEQTSADSTRGTVDYTISNPTTRLYLNDYNTSNGDWHYAFRDNTLWASDKTIYDPCPQGWRVPDGGNNGIWANASLSAGELRLTNSTELGGDFSNVFGDDDSIWYPSIGIYGIYVHQNLMAPARWGTYWSVTPAGNAAYSLGADYAVWDTVQSSSRAAGYAVRCMKE